MSASGLWIIRGLMTAVFCRAGSMLMMENVGNRDRKVLRYLASKFATAVCVPISVACALIVCTLAAERISLTGKIVLLVLLLGSWNGVYAIRLARSSHRWWPLRPRGKERAAFMVGVILQVGRMALVGIAIVGFTMAIGGKWPHGVFLAIVGGPVFADLVYFLVSDIDVVRESRGERIDQGVDGQCGAED